jgi:hypothetical protein
MSLPVEYDFALVKYSDMAGSPVFTTLCGITDVTVNQVAETQSRRVRDCATPNKPGAQKIKVLGTSFTITGTGLTNAAIRTVIETNLFAKKVNYKIEYYADDGTDGGDLLGTHGGLAVLNADNLSIATEGESSQEFTFEGEGELTYTAAT